MADPSARTEPASPRALRRAREAGDVPRSRVASLAFAWLGLSLGLGAGASAAVEALRDFSTRVFSLEALIGSHPPNHALGGPLGDALGEAAALGASAVLLPLSGVLVLGALGEAAIMGRVLLNPVRIDVSRLAPSRNLSVATDLRPRLGALAAAFLLGLVLVDLFRDAAPGVFGRVSGSVEIWSQAVGTVGGALLVRAAVALAILGAAATAFARYSWRQRHRMTRRERAREQRETEGDPTAKRRRRTQHRELSDAPSRSEVLRDAALLVQGAGMTVALAWRNREAAPTIDAVVLGPAAARLVLEGRGVPSLMDPGLALELARCRRGSEVPARLWPRVTRPLSRAGARAGDRKRG